jgi:hypothetical protein
MYAVPDVMLAVDYLRAWSKSHCGDQIYLEKWYRGDIEQALK